MMQKMKERIILENITILTGNIFSIKNEVLKTTLDYIEQQNFLNKNEENWPIKIENSRGSLYSFCYNYRYGCESCSSEIVSDYIKKTTNINNTVFDPKQGLLYYLMEDNEIEFRDGLHIFGILILLIDKGILNKDSLIVIENPENKLHPQYVVELAKIIVLINKEIGCRFLITSNNSDFVLATKYIGLKENVKTDFYLCDEEKAYYTKNGIESIFGSFNKSLDLINEYGI
jgi:hypothetical protein